MDAYGLRPQIEQMAERIADHGYVVLAPNVFYRAGRSPVVSLEGIDDPDRRSEVFGRVMPLVQGLTADQIVSDGAAYLDRLGDVPVAKKGVAIAGWDKDAAARAMTSAAYTIVVDLGQGGAAARHLACDLSHDYVTINADYTT